MGGTVMVSPPALRVALVTVTESVALWPSRVPVMVAVPVATPVTRPDASTVATAGSLLVQLTEGVTFTLLPSL
ncbi:hypothetical protein D3C85_1730080 [compost metagenome]